MNYFSEFYSIVVKIIIYSGIVQGFYSAMVLTHTKLKNPANLYLAILLIILSVSILHSVFIVSYFQQFHQITFHIKEPFILLVVPSIWLYVKKLNEPNFHLHRKHIAHIIPFFLVMMFSITHLVVRSHMSNFNILNSHVLVFNIIVWFTALIQYLFYLFYILKLIANFKSKALNELSNTENIDLTWLRIFLFTFLSVFVLLVVMMISAIHQFEIKYFNNIISVVFALAIFLLGYKGLFQQTILPVNEVLQDIEAKQFEKKAEEVGFDKERLSNLLNYMVIEKPFREPELTLTSLATKINISRNQLSELINSGTEGNFYDFVNTYRVEEVKQLMIDSKYKDYTLLAIAFEAGFPSKSTFNSIFKKNTGLTPSEYRNSLS
jgi:AraC-like DNA-binding protein